MKSNIGRLIEESGLKKRYIAKQVGVNENTITNWIKGRSYPALDKAVLLANLLECTVDDLIEGRDR